MSTWSWNLDLPNQLTILSDLSFHECVALGALFAIKNCLCAVFNWQVGPEGAGHFVKMVHNGIEYGDMQLICEAYQLMKQALGMSNDEISDVCQINYLLIWTVAGKETSFY